MGYQLGIDLGTTFTAAAIARDGHVDIVSLGNRAATIPSMVFLREDNAVAIGDAAERHGAQNPARLAREFKRRFGDPIPLLLDRTPVTADQLTAMLLRQVVAGITKLQGGAPDTIVIAHPANWGQSKVELLRLTAGLAGLDDPILVTEPVASAVQYASGERVEIGDNIAVYDLGGSTFDAVVLRKTATGFDTLGQTQGIERLGGIDFDEAMFTHVRSALGDAFNSLDTSDPATRDGIARLRRDCIAAKEALSADLDATVAVMLPNIQSQVWITRAEFENMIRSMLRETINSLRRAISAAGINTAQIKVILLTGGSSRIPIISELLRTEFDRPIVTDAHPKHSVALGAARTTAPPATPPQPLQEQLTNTASPKPSQRKAFTIIGVALVAVVAVTVFALTRPDDATKASSSSAGATSLAPTPTVATTATAAGDTLAAAPVPTTTTPGAVPLPAAVVVPDGAVDLGHSVFFTLPDGYSSVPSGEGSINITDGTFSMQAAVVVRPPGEDPITVLQEYIDTFDPTFESVAYTQTNIRSADTSGVVPGDGMFLFYRELDNSGASGAKGTIEIFRRGDGLTFLTDVYNSIDDQSGTTFPQGSIDELRTSFLAAPLVGNPVELTPLPATRTTSVHESFEVDGLVRLTPPAGWTVKLPGPGLVWISRPDGQTFVAGRVADLADLEAAKSLGQADVLKLQPTAVFENAIDFSDPVAYNFTTAYWHATDPTGQLISGSISIWFNPNSGEAYEALQFWVGATDVPPSTLESAFLFQSLYASITSSR